MRAFREFHTRHPWLVVPEVVGERSSQRVLTLTFEPGDSINELDELGYDQEVRNELGEHIFHVMCSQVFDFGRIHGDPNPGNMAFRKDGKLVLYDFGCVKTLQHEIVAAYRDGIMFGIDEDYDMVEDALRRLGVRRVSGPPVDYAYYKQWRDIFANPFLDAPIYDYGASTIHDEVVKMIPSVMKRMASFQAAKELIFLDRMVAGQYGNLCKLRARLPALQILHEYMDPWTGFEGIPERAVGSTDADC